LFVLQVSLHTQYCSSGSGGLFLVYSLVGKFKLVLVIMRMRTVSLFFTILRNKMSLFQILELKVVAIILRSQPLQKCRQTEKMQVNIALPVFLATTSTLDVNFVASEQVWIKDGVISPNIFAANGQAQSSAGLIVKQGLF
jgi:hypothetical protein